MLVTDSLGNSACAESAHQHKFKHQTCCRGYQRRSNTLDAWNQRTSIHPHRYLQRACFSEGTQKVKNCFKTLCCITVTCFARPLQISMFLVGLLWKLEVIKVNKTPIFTIHFKPLLDTRSQKKKCVLRICVKSM